MMTYHERNARALSRLDPVVAARLEKALIVLDMLDQDILITDSVRTEEEQNALYAKGRTAPGKIVTHVRGRNSYHVWGVAFDIVPIWFGFTQYSNSKRYEQIARILTGLDFDWGFQMWGFDKPHFQYTQGLTLDDFYIGKRLKPEPLHELEVPEPEDMKARGLFRRLERYLARQGVLLVAKVAGKDVP